MFRAYLLLAVASAAWAGNIVLGRAVRAEIPPIGMAFWRWLLALLVGGVVLVPALLRNAAVLRREWKLILVLGALGMALFHSLLYAAVHSTSAINASLILATTPIFVPFASRWILGQGQTRHELIGAVLSTLGVAVIVSRGELAVFRQLTFSLGDLLMVVATAAWALYSVVLKRKPADLEPSALLGACMTVAVLTLLPFYLWESQAVQRVPFTRVSVLVLGYQALAASLLAYVCYNAAVALVGPVHAGLSINLIPFFATVLALLFLGERLHGFHLVGMLMIALGLWLAARVSLQRTRRGRAA
jgi:drug/metabolite transporter (DMT)-like permease